MRTFWTGKKVLVTGADGFIGSHLTERLAREGASVTAFTWYNSFGSSGWLDTSETRDSIHLLSGDIRDSSRVAEGVRGAEYVFHLASLIAIPYSYVAAESYVQTNVQGTLNVLNACRTFGVKRLIHTSTSEVYGSARYVPMDEGHPLQAQSPYAASKIAADKLVESYFCSFGLPATIVRPFNTYGPRQSCRAIVPTIFSQLWKGAGVLTLGSLEPIRDLNYVADTVDGFLRAAECPAAVGEVLNVGSGHGTRIRDLVEMAFTVTNRRADISIQDNRIRPEKSEVNRLICNSNRMRQLTGWAPAHNLEKGLALTSEWICNHLDSIWSEGMPL